MKQFITTLAITSTLVITQACASQVNRSETPDSNATTVSNANPHTDHNMEDSKTPQAKENSQ